MRLHHPPNLIGLLRSTLRKVEEQEKLRPGDPSLQALKRAIARTLAELELRKSKVA